MVGTYNLGGGGQLYILLIGEQSHDITGMIKNGVAYNPEPSIRKLQ